MTDNGKRWMLIGAGAALLMLGGRKVIDLSNANENERKYAPAIAAAEQANGIPAGLLHKMIRVESHFRTDIITGKVKSKPGALGIAQFMPATAREELGSEVAALNPEVAIAGAARYLKKLHQQTGSWQGAVAAYNWGVGRVKRLGLDKAPPETKAYIAAVFA